MDRSTYAVAPYFMWQSPRPEPVYHHPAMHDFYTHNELDFYQQTRTPLGMLAVIAAKFFHLWMFYLGPLLTLPFVMVIATLPMGFSWRSISRETASCWRMAGHFFAGLALEVFFFPHYAAPLTCVIFALLLVALRRVRQWEWHGRPAGQFVVRALPLGCALLLSVRAGRGPAALALDPGLAAHLVQRRSGCDRPRADVGPVAKRCPKSSSSSYDSRRIPRRCTDWVYNPADIDQAKVVWAMDMGAARNQELIDYYKDRQVWLAEPDKDSAKWGPYPGANEK